MNCETTPEPQFFLKPDAAKAGGENPVESIDCKDGQIHHEVELVIQLDHNQKPSAVAIGLDLTMRAIQSELKEQGLPWTRAKSFTNSAILGNWVQLAQKMENYGVGLEEFISNLHISLKNNGVVVQSAYVSEMTHSPLQQLEKLLQWAPMCTEDTLFTGTPSGVGPLAKGQEIEALLKYSNGDILSQINATCC